MPLTSQQIEEGLLTRNFFPRVAKRGDEFPPAFTSADFAPVIAHKLAAASSKRKNGYGVIEARSTRYDLAPRTMGILHPRAFASICSHLAASSKHWNSIESNPSSAIRVREHPDGRIFSMIATTDSDVLVVPGSRYWVSIDITNFYGSIYTHSFPWAIHGVQAAKQIQNNKSDWTNRLDAVLREARRKETTGIAVGPGTSAIAGEILLNEVDRQLRNQGFNYLRFIDDFYFASPTRERAERFVAAVREELSKLKLSIHPGKTSISSLPLATSPSWQRQLRTALRGAKSAGRLSDAIDEAIDSAAIDTENGALRYLLVTLEDIILEVGVDAPTRIFVVERLLHLAFLWPAATGTACKILAALGKEAVKSHKEALNTLLIEHSRALRTDATTWIAHTLISHGVLISRPALRRIYKSGDCMTLALLIEDGRGKRTAREFLQALESENPEDYRRDEYWLLYYQLKLRGRSADIAPAAYYEDFKALLDANVSFVDITHLADYRPAAPATDENPEGPRSGTRNRAYDD